MTVISKYETTFQMFKALADIYEINNTSRALTLNKQLHHIKMNKGETVTSYFLRITELRDQLSTIGHIVDNKELAMMALNGLPTSWESFIQGISARSKFPKFDRLKTDCIQEESWLVTRGIKQNNGNEDIQVLNSNSYKKGKKKNFKRKRDNCSNGKRSSKKKRDISEVQCFRCDQYGHYAMKCLDRIKQHASMVEVNKGSDSERLVFYSTLSSQVTSSSNTWVIDSGASRHITGFREHLDTLVENSNEEVTIGDDSNYPVMGIGTCNINLKSGISLQRTGVLFVPGIKRNIVSVSALEDKGYRLTFMEGKVLAWPKNSTIKKAHTIGVRQGSLYRLCTTPPQALIHETPDSNELWYKRLGHLHFHALPKIEKMVIGLPKLSHSSKGACKGCALGKNTKGSFNSSNSKSKNVLELVHFDLCGPMSVPSLGGFFLLCNLCR